MNISLHHNKYNIPRSQMTDKYYKSALNTFGEKAEYLTIQCMRNSCSKTHTYTHTHVSAIKHTCISLFIENKNWIQEKCKLEVLEKK